MTRLSGNIIVDPFVPAGFGDVVLDGEDIVSVEAAVGTSRPNEPWLAPGLIDTHTHPVGTGLEVIFPDLRRCRTIAEVLERVRGGLARGRELGFLCAYNLEPDALQERRLPGAAELDAVVPDTPVMVYRVDGHSAALNSAALALLAEPRLPGVKTGADGRPTGTVSGQAYEQAARRFGRLRPPELTREALSAASNAALSRGATTVAAMVGSPVTGPDEWQLLVDALESANVTMVPFLQTWNPSVPAGFGLARVGGCLLLDGSFGSHTAALKTDYSDAPGSTGICYQTDETASELVRSAAEHELQTTFHAIGDRAIEQLVSIHERLGDTREPALRHRIEHAELLSPRLVERIAALGLVLGVQPPFETTWGGPAGMYSRRLGSRWQSTNPLRRLVDAGVRIAGGSDSPITPLDPLAGIRAAMTLPNESQRLTGPEALALYTSWAAYSLGLEDRVGTLQPGMAADIVVLDRDPRSGAECRVLATYRRGQMAYEAPP